MTTGTDLFAPSAGQPMCPLRRTKPFDTEESDRPVCRQLDLERVKPQASVLSRLEVSEFGFSPTR